MDKTSKLSRLFKFFWLTDNDRREFLKEWDELLQLLIKHGEVTKLGEYTVTFNNKYEVWISNHPYASGHLYELNGKRLVNSYSCSKDTKILLEDFINEYVKIIKTDPIIDYLREEKEKISASL